MPRGVPPLDACLGPWKFAKKPPYNKKRIRQDKVA
jgi:hypothetical protein